MVPTHSHAPDANKPNPSALRPRKTPENAKCCNMLRADLMTQLRRFGEGFDDRAEENPYLFRWKRFL